MSTPMSTGCRLHRNRSAGGAVGPTALTASALHPARSAPAGFAPRSQHTQLRGRCSRSVTQAAGPGSSGGAAAVTDAAPDATTSPDQQDALVEGLMAFLREDLQHLFDDQGIDSSNYDPDVVFEDPITFYNGIQGYLFNIAFLRKIFSPLFILHDLKRTGPLEITTRWTMSMSLIFARGTPLGKVWDPTLTFTGTSIMEINPQTGRFCRHSDTWDAINSQRYFSVEAFAHMLSQVGDLRRGPKGDAAGQYETLLKRKQYEVRRYSQLPAGTTVYCDGGGSAERVSSGSGSGSGNASGSSSIGGEHAVYAVGLFTGDPTQAAASSAERDLRTALLAAGMQPAGRSWQVAAGGGSPAVLRRNEVLIPLQSFELWG